MSSFRWNEVIFRSFQSGNLKQLDLEFYLKLRLPTTKRMYRFLDKRFYRRSRLDFDLRTLACEHIGLSRSYAPTELKRRLKPALEEMEQLGFLEPLSAEERYSLRQARLLEDYFHSRSPRNRRRREPCCAGRTTACPARRGPQSTRGYQQDRPGTGRHSLPRPNSDQDRGLRLAVAKRGQESRQEPCRLSGGIDPFGLSGTGRLSQWLSQGLNPQERQPSARMVYCDRARPNSGTVRRFRHSATKYTRPNFVLPGSRLPEAERETILAAVKSQNPGLGRWKNMLEPLCLSVLETRLNENSTASGQRLLFPDAELAK